MKARRKPCRHCLFSKNALGTKLEQIEAKGQIAQGLVFKCHEHSAPTLCNGYCRKYPERVPAGTEFTNQNGDLKSHYAHMTRQQMNKCRMGG